MRIFRWLFGTIQGVSAFVLLVGGAILTIIEIGDRLNTPDPITLPSLPDSVPPDFSTPLAERLASAFAAAGCASGVVAVVDFVQGLTPSDDGSHGRDGVFLQLELGTSASRITVQGTGHGAAAQANARANLLANIETALKESDACD